MRKFTKINESLGLVDKMIGDVDQLRENLDYLKKFLEGRVNDNNELEIYKSLTSIHTDIQLLSSKISPRK
jgi:hypothetical protein